MCKKGKLHFASLTLPSLSHAYAFHTETRRSKGSRLRRHTIRWLGRFTPFVSEAGGLTLIGEFMIIQRQEEH